MRASLASMEKSQGSAPFDRTSQNQAEATLSTIVEAAGSAARERKRVILREELIGLKLACALEARRLKRFESFQFSISRSAFQFPGNSHRRSSGSTLGARPSGSSLAAGDLGPLAASTRDMEGQSDAEFMSSLSAAESSPNDDILDISVTSGNPGQRSLSNSWSHAAGKKGQHYVPPYPMTKNQQPLDLSKNDAQNTKSDKDLPASFEISAVTNSRPDTEGSASEGKAVGSLWGRANRTRMWLGKGGRSPSQDWRSTWWGRTIMWLFYDSTDAAMLTRAVKRFRYESDGGHLFIF